MSKQNKLAIVIAAVLGVGGLLFWLLSTQPKAYNWQETFQAEGSEPYDLSLLRSLLPGFFPEKEFHEINHFSSDTAFYHAQNAALIYIDGRVRIDSTLSARLLDFAEKGNTVFISASNEHGLLEAILGRCGDPPHQKWLRTRKAKKIRPSILPADSARPEIYYQVVDKIERYPWSYFDVSTCGLNDVRQLGSFEAIDSDYINLIKAQLGAGQVILHSTPLIFSNYHFKRDDVIGHAEEVLQQIPEAHIYFVQPDLSLPRTPNRPLLTESPLRFILGNEALRWAWYLLLVLSATYVLSQMRRIQRPIPIRMRPENNAIGQVEVFTRFYQKEGLHKHIIQLQLKLLLSHLRRKYGIYHKPSDPHFFAEAAEKIDKPPDELKAFFDLVLRASHNSSLSDAEFLVIDQKITEFYATCP